MSKGQQDSSMNGQGYSAPPRSAKDIEDKTTQYASMTASTANKMSHIVHDVTDSLTHTTKSLTSSYITQPLGYTVENVRTLLNRYPLLRSFVYIFALFSFIPLSVFTLFGLGSLTATLIVALSGVTVVQSILLFPAGAVLCLFLMGAAGVTMTLFGGFTLAWFSIAALKVTSTKLNRLMGGTAATVEKDVIAVEHGVSRGLGGSTSRR